MSVSMMDHLFVFLSLFIVMIGILFTILRAPAGNATMCVEGRSVLSAERLRAHRVIALTGEWLCVRNRLLDPAVADLMPLHEWEVVRMPSAQETADSSEPLQAVRHSMTYRLHITLPKSNTIWGLRTNHPEAILRIYANHEEIQSEFGSDAFFPEDLQASDDVISLFHVPGRELDLLIHFQGTAFERSTLMLQIGTGRRVIGDRMGGIVVDSVACCSFLILFLYIVLQCLQRKPQSRLERAMIPFSFYLLAICISIMTRSEGLLVFFFPRMPLPVHQGIQLFTDMASCIFLMRYVKLLTREDESKLDLYCLPVAGLIAVLASMLDIAWMNAYAWQVFSLLGGLFLLGAWYHLIKNFKQIEYGGWLIILGLASSSGMFVCTLLSDIIGPMRELMRYGIPVFVLSQILFALKTNHLLRQHLETQRYAALQARIKPHFLLNSISAIRYFCKKDGVMADRLLENLSLLLREKLQGDGVDEWHPLSEELLLCRAYVSIARARFGDKIQYVESPIPLQDDVVIPSMTIQPLVENAICHGLADREKGVHVHVVMEYWRGSLIVRVNDDGPGMQMVFDDNPLSYGVWKRQVNEKDYHRKGGDVADNREVGISLENIQARLLHLGEAGLFLGRSPAGGLSVSFSLSLNRKGDAHHAFSHDCG